MEEKRNRRITCAVTEKQRTEIDRLAAEWKTSVADLAYAAIMREFANFE